MKRVLAFDFGASSGRAMLAECDGERITLTEAHRFENAPVNEDGVLRWDIDALFGEIETGVRKAWERSRFDSIAFDTWGVDFGLLGPDGLLEKPMCYRDESTAGRVQILNERLGDDTLYRRTGIQQMDLNTVYQLDVLRETRPQLLERAECLLLMPDLFAWMLTGTRVAELSEASTTGLLDPRGRDWDWELIRKLGLPERIFPPVVRAGAFTGTLRPELCAKWGVPPLPVIAAASHDTASAVAAIPSGSEESCFLSCGTWSLLGTELSEPVIGPDSRDCGLTNELGYGGGVNFLKNIIGLWLIQETRRQFRREGKEYSYADMERLARESPAFASFIDPDAPEFVPPGDIPGRIREACRKTGQTVPQTDGAVVRCVYESLALKYRYAIGQLRRCTGRAFTRLHLVGGGGKDGFLCQMTADATGLSVDAGPIEATALGNAAVQLIALGELSDLAAAREVIARSYAPARFLPREPGAWAEAAKRFNRLDVRD